MSGDKNNVCYSCGTGTLRMAGSYCAYYCDHCFAIFSMVEVMLYEMPSSDYDVPPRTWARRVLGDDGMVGLLAMLGRTVVDVRNEPLVGKDLDDFIDQISGSTMRSLLRETWGVHHD